MTDPRVEELLRNHRARELAQMVVDLEADNHALHERNAELEREIQRLRAGLEGPLGKGKTS